LDLVALFSAQSAAAWLAWLGGWIEARGHAARGGLIWQTESHWVYLSFQGGDAQDLVQGHPLPAALDTLVEGEPLPEALREGIPTMLPHAVPSCYPLKGNEEVFGLLLWEGDEALALPEARWNLALKAAERLALLDLQKSRQVLAQEMEKQQGNFLNIINHELRTPLTAIMGFSDLACDLPVMQEDQVLRQFVEGIRFSAKNLNQRISELLTMGGISSAQLQVERDECQLPELMREFKEQVLPDIPEHSRVQLPREVPELVLRTDSQHFQRILVHLVGNALKFSSSDQDVIVQWNYLVGRRATDLGDYIRLDVVDSGPGIALAEQEKIFEKFYQVEDSDTRSQGGMGLGLTLSKEFVEAMGGRLWLQSEPGEGSTFSFTLPLVP
jgi:signal transduction histidine kinase